MLPSYLLKAKLIGLDGLCNIAYAYKDMGAAAVASMLHLRQALSAASCEHMALRSVLISSSAVMRRDVRCRVPSSSKSIGWSVTASGLKLPATGAK